MNATSTTIRNSPAAVWSLVLGIADIVLCLGVLTGIPAIICGIVAQSGIRKSAGALSGAGMAITGLILGSIATLLSVFVLPIAAAIMIPAFASAQQKAREAVSMNQVKQIVVACQIYASDHDGQVPESLEILVQEDILTPEVLRNPRQRDTAERAYELVYRGRIADAADPSTTPLVREIEPGRMGRRVVGYLDGHVELVMPGQDGAITVPDGPEAVEARPES